MIIKQEFQYECDPTDLTDSQNLIKEINKELELSSDFDKRYYKDKISELLNKMIDKRSEFMSQRESEVINQFKELFDLKDATFQELFQQVPELTEYFHMKFRLNSKCENAIDDLIRLFSRLI